MEESMGSSRKWKHRVVWSICDTLVEQGLNHFDITDAKLVEALKAKGHAPGNPNQRLKYLREWKEASSRDVGDHIGDHYRATTNSSRTEYSGPNQLNSAELERLASYEKQIAAYIDTIHDLKEQVSVANEALEKAHDKNAMLEESLSATTHSLSELRDRSKTLEYEESALAKENKHLQSQLLSSQAQYKNVELLLNKITDAHEKMLRDKTQALKDNYEQDNRLLNAECVRQEKLLTETQQRLQKLELDYAAVFKEYQTLKEEADNWEGEKKRLTIELAKARTKQFTNEFSQFSEAYQSFTKAYVTNAQTKTQGYINQCFERMYALFQFELKQARQKGTPIPELPSFTPPEGKVSGEPE